MFTEKESLLPVLHADSKFILLLAFVGEYRKLYGIAWHSLKDKSISEGSCIAQDEGRNLLMALCLAREWHGEWLELVQGSENQARQVLELVFNALIWILNRHPDRFPQTLQMLEHQFVTEKV
jgi:hypothetical protein